jgi:hypothetical protein
MATCVAAENVMLRRVGSACTPRLALANAT